MRHTPPPHPHPQYLFFMSSLSPPQNKEIGRTKLVCLVNELIKRKLAVVERWLLAVVRFLNQQFEHQDEFQILGTLKFGLQKEIVLLQATLRVRAAGVRSVEKPGPLWAPRLSLQAPRACSEVECMNSVAVCLAAAPAGEGGDPCGVTGTAGSKFNIALFLINNLDACTTLEQPD